jgi:rare lipoprotein A
MSTTFSTTILTLTLFFSTCAIAAAQTGTTETQHGFASYYADSFKGKKMSNGESYNPRELTCAHKRLPFNTMIKVTRLDNKKTVTVRVTDRGPYVAGRIIELSRAAAERLDMIDVGVAEVTIEVISSPTAAREAKPQATETARRETPRPPSSYEAPSARVDEQAPKATARASEPEKPRTAADQKTEKPAAARPAESSSTRARLVGKEYQQYGLYKISLEKPAGQGFAVQVASLENYENVFKQVADLQAKWFENILISIEKGKERPLYKIMLGPFDNEAAANNYRKNLQSKHRIRGFVVNLAETTY